MYGSLAGAADSAPALFMDLLDLKHPRLWRTETERMTSSRNHGSVRGDLFLLDHLEQRQLLAADFVGVGLGYSDKVPDGFDAWAVLINANISDTNDITGQLTTSGPSNPITSGALTPRKLFELGNGRVSFGTQPWLLPQFSAETNAASFLDSKGFPLGWAVGDYTQDDNLTGESLFFVERPTNATIEDLQGDWSMSLLGESGSNFVVTNASLKINGAGLQFLSDSPQFDPVTDFTIDSVNANGDINLSNDTVNRFFISRDKTVIIFVGLGNVTDDAIIGVAMRGATAADPARLTGSYRVNTLYAQDLGTSWDAEDSGAVEGLLTLKSDNTWSMNSLDDNDKGKTTSVISGTWATDGGLVSLTDAATNTTLLFVVNPDHDALLGYSTQTSSIDFLGVATKTVPVTVTPSTFNASFASYSGKSGGQDKVWELGDDSYWREVNLASVTGAPSTLTDLVSWIDQGTGRTNAAAISDTSGVLLFSRAADGTWSVRELTPTITGAIDIASQLEVMQDVDGTTYIVGFTQAGDIVSYVNAMGSSDWSFKNITQEDLIPNAQTIPGFQGNLVSYDTAWGGLNLAGLDSNGDVWSVWTAPGLTTWNTSNLSQITAATVKFAGGLTVYLTPWQGINIAGVDTTGNISTVWWVPEFVGEWRQNDLTAQFGGPKLNADSVTSYTTTWGGLNIVGFDSDSGEVKVYWWAPGITDWNITSLSQTVGTGAAQPTTKLQGVAGTDGSLNVLGFTSGNDLVNYFWRPDFGGSWYATNVSNDAFKM